MSVVYATVLIVARVRSVKLRGSPRAAYQSFGLSVPTTLNPSPFGRTTTASPSASRTSATSAMLRRCATTMRLAPEPDRSWSSSFRVRTIGDQLHQQSMINAKSSERWTSRSWTNRPFIERAPVLRYIPIIMTNALETAVLTTVNAPYRTYLDAKGLVTSIVDGQVSVAQVGSFFTEIAPETQRAFATQHGVSEAALVRTASAFQSYSGQDVALAA